MRHPARKERVSPGRLLVHVCVEAVAGEFGEMFDICQADLPASGTDRMADFEFLEIQAERVLSGGSFRGARNPSLADPRQHSGASLDGDALHVRKNAPDSTELFTGPGPAGSAMDHLRHRRSVPGGFPRAFAVADIDPPVPCPDGPRKASGRFCIGGKQRNHQAAAATSCQRGRILLLPVGHDRGNRSERLDLMDPACIAGILADEQEG